MKNIYNKRANKLEGENVGNKNLIEKFNQYPVTDKNIYSGLSEWDFFLPEPKNINSNRKKLVIELSENVVNPLKLIGKENYEVERIIGMNIKKFFPLRYLNTKMTPYEILKFINENKNYIAYINENSFIRNSLGLNKIKGKSKEMNNLRYVTSIVYMHFTLIVPIDSKIISWRNLGKKKIGTLRRSSSLEDLNRLLMICKYNKSSVTIITYRSMKEMNDGFVRGEIDCIYMTITHPNKNIFKLSIRKRIKLILTNGLPYKELEYFYPWGWKKYVDTRYYNTIPYPNPILPSYALRKIIATNKDTDKNKIYNLIKSLFENIEYIQSLMTSLKKFEPFFMIYLNPANKYHDGVRKYLFEMNYITNNSNISCVKFIGTGVPCSSEELENNNAINKEVNFANPLNYQNYKNDDLEVSTIYNSFKSQLENPIRWNRVYSPEYMNDPNNNSDNQKWIFFNYVRQINSGQVGILPIQ